MGIGSSDSFFAPGDPAWGEDVEYRCPVPGCKTRRKLSYVKASDPPRCRKHNALLVEADLEEARRGFAERVKAKIVSKDGRAEVDKLISESSSTPDDESETVEDIQSGTEGGPAGPRQPGK